MKIELDRMPMDGKSVIEFRRALERLAFNCFLCIAYDECERRITIEKLGKREDQPPVCVGYIEGEGAGGESCFLTKKI